MFSVTETTVKRWADEGSLRCHRTPGGHRKFEMRHVVEFAERNNFDPVGTLEVVGKDRIGGPLQLAVLSRDFTTLQEEFVRRALSVSRTDLYTFLSFLYEHRIQLWEIFDLVLAPGMREIGDRWVRGELGVGYEHRASYETLDALAKLQARIAHRPPVGRSVLLALVGQEQHEIGLRCAASLFEAEGWEIHYLGAQTPAEALITVLLENAPAVLCLSITQSELASELQPSLTDIVAAAGSVRSRVIIGGRAAATGRALSGTGALVVSSSRELLEFLHRYRPDDSGTLPVHGRSDS